MKSFFHFDYSDKKRYQVSKLMYYKIFDEVKMKQVELQVVRDVDKK